MHKDRIKRLIGTMLAGTVSMTSSISVYGLAPTRTYTETMAIQLPDGGKGTVDVTFEDFIGFLDIELPIYDGTAMNHHMCHVAVVRKADTQAAINFDLAYEGPRESVEGSRTRTRYTYDKTLEGFRQKEVGETIREESYLTDAIFECIADGKRYFVTGYEYMLVLSETDEDYFTKHGRLHPEEPFTWSGLRELLGGTNPKPVLKKVFTPSTTVRLVIDGKTQELEAYNIDGNNFFKLRDLAQLLRDSEKAFDVGWNPEQKLITLRHGVPYKGGDTTLYKGDGTMHEANLLEGSIRVDEATVFLDAYTIEGSNYFKLRDLASNMHFYVGWDEATTSITIDTNRNYEQ